jgi:arylsulfatase A-like enzyme
MKLLVRGLRLGVVFGLAAATVEIWLNLFGFVERRFGPGPLFFAQTAALQAALGAILGVVAAPLLRLPRGPIVQTLALAVAWAALERLVVLDAPLFRRMELVPAAGALLLLALGSLVARRRPWLTAAVGVALLAGGMLAPGIYLELTTPELARRAELPPARKGAPDVVLIVLDTVRAENVSTYGYRRPTAPALDALAAEGTLFVDATSPSTWSLPSHASLFTGRYPSSHGAHSEHRFLDARFPTLAEALQLGGYETYCITANAWISDGLGLTRGFAWQDESLRAQGGAGRGFSFIHRLLDRLGLQEADKGGGLVASRFEEWARERPADAERPAFVFLNFIEAHFPYHQLPHDALHRFTDLPYGALRKLSLDLLGQQFGGPGRPVEEAAEPARDMYDGGIVYTSDLLSRVVEALRARGTLDDTVLVVLADHGELLGERAGFFGHGPTLYQESVGVPLLVRYPPRIPAGARVDTPVSTLGVFATVLDLAGLPAPPTLQVGSLAPLARGEDGTGGPILAELHRQTELALGPPRRGSDPQMDATLRYRLLREGSLKLVATSAGDHLLYDLAVDPGETRDLAAERPADLAHMRARLAQIGSEFGLPALDAETADGDAPELDEATRAQLRALGYAE